MRDDVVSRIPAHVHALAREIVNDGRARSLYEALELMAEAWRYASERVLLPGGRVDDARMSAVLAAHAARTRQRIET